MNWLIPTIVIVSSIILLAMLAEYYSRRITKTFRANHYIERLAARYEKDDFEFYKDERGDWWWRRKSVNGEIVGASTEGYRNKKDCVENAERNGFVRWVHKNNL